MSKRSRAVVLAVSLFSILLAMGTPAGAVVTLSDSPSPTWQTYGNKSSTAPSGRVRAITTIGNIAYFGGYFTSVRPPGNSTALTTRNHLAALDLTTGNLTSWNPNADKNVWAMAADPAANRIYVAGDFTTIGGQTMKKIAAIDATTGALITSFKTNVAARVRTLVVGTGAYADRIFIGGKFAKVDNKTQLYIAALSKSTGKLIESWRPSITQVADTCPPRCTPEVASLALGLDGNSIYVGGHFGLVNGVLRNNVARITLDDSETLLAWDPSVLVPYPTNPNQKNFVYDISVTSNRVYFCGDFYKVNNGWAESPNGKVSPNFAGVDPDTGRRDPSWNKTSTNGGTPACQYSAAHDAVFIGGHFTLIGDPANKFDNPNAVERNHVAAVSAANGSPIDPWDPWANSSLGLHAIHIDGDLVLIGGDFDRTGGGSSAASSRQQGIAVFAPA